MLITNLLLAGILIVLIGIATELQELNRRMKGKP